MLNQSHADFIVKRERSRSPRRRSRSPRRSRRSYSPRSRSRSREEYRRSDRRSRSPMSGAPGGYNSGSAYGRGGGQAPPVRSFEERAQAKEQMMASVREASQQERRVYVGNLSYDVKWHHLKDFMRQGEIPCSCSLSLSSSSTDAMVYSWGGSFRGCPITSEWNVEGGRQYVEWLVFLVFSWLLDVGLTGWDTVHGLCRDAGR